MQIDSFFGPHRFLSNFWFASVVLDGVEYPSVEHAYQAAKTEDPDVRATIRACAPAGSAKHAGGSLPTPDDWDERRLVVMRDLIEQKFAAEPLRSQLLETGTQTLVEGNGWGDTFWGVSKGAGTNHLGNLLMAVRARLRGQPQPILAVDLEGTLISNAVSAFARPRLAEFLGWASTRFAQVVLYTAVPAARAAVVLKRVTELDGVPAAVMPTRVLTQEGPCKGLHHVDRDTWPILLLDDQAGAVCPDEVEQWVPIQPWSAPYANDDDGLRGARQLLEAAIARRWA